MKLGQFIIGLMLVGLCVAVIISFYVKGAQMYGQDFNDTSYSVYNQTSALQEQVKSMNSTLQSIDAQDTTVTSFVTAFLGSGWSVIKTTFKSFGVFTAMADSTFDNTPMGNDGGVFKSYLIMIAITIFFLVLVGILVGKDLI